MPPWLTILLGGLSSLASLGKGQQAEQTATNASKPGGLPGTLGPSDEILPYSQIGISAIDNNPFVEQLRAQANEGARYDPRVAGVLGYGSAREQQVQPLLQQNIDNIRNSGLTGIADRLSGEASRLQGNRDSAIADRQASRQKLSATGDRLQGQASDLANRTDQYFSRVANDPTVVSQGEMDAIVGNLIAKSSADYGARNAQLEADAVSRGRSADATNAAKTLLGEAQRNDQAQSTRDAYLTNAIAGRQRADQAAQLRASLVGQLIGLQGNLGTGFGEQDAALLDAIDRANIGYTSGISGLLGQEAGLRDTYAQRLNAANTDLGGFLDSQAQIPLTIGDILAQRGDYNTLLRAGAYNAAADRLGNVGGGLMNLGYSDMMSRRAEAAANSGGGLFGGGGSDIAGLGSLGFLGPGAFGLATGAAPGLIGADLLMAGGLGSLRR